jgi:hypothetical protein
MGIFGGESILNGLVQGKNPQETRGFSQQFHNNIGHPLGIYLLVVFVA